MFLSACGPGGPSQVAVLGRGHGTVEEAGEYPQDSVTAGSSSEDDERSLLQASQRQKLRRKASEGLKPPSSFQRRLAFVKRKKSIVLKAFQLHQLTDSKVFLMVVNDQGSSWAYASPGFEAALNPDELHHLRQLADEPHMSTTATQVIPHPQFDQDGLPVDDCPLNISTIKQLPQGNPNYSTQHFQLQHDKLAVVLQASEPAQPQHGTMATDGGHPGWEQGSKMLAHTHHTGNMLMDGHMLQAVMIPSAGVPPVMPCSFMPYAVMPIMDASMQQQMAMQKHQWQLRMKQSPSKQPRQQQQVVTTGNRGMVKREQQAGVQRNSSCMNGSNSSIMFTAMTGVQGMVTTEGAQGRLPPKPGMRGSLHGCATNQASPRKPHANAKDSLMVTDCDGNVFRVMHECVAAPMPGGDNSRKSSSSGKSSGGVIECKPAVQQQQQRSMHSAGASQMPQYNHHTQNNDSPSKLQSGQKQQKHNAAPSSSVLHTQATGAMHGLTMCVTGPATGDAMAARSAAEYTTAQYNAAAAAGTAAPKQAWQCAAQAAGGNRIGRPPLAANTVQYNDVPVQHKQQGVVTLQATRNGSTCAVNNATLASVPTSELQQQQQALQQPQQCMQLAVVSATFPAARGMTMPDNYQSMPYCLPAPSDAQLHTQVTEQQLQSSSQQVQQTGWLLPPPAADASGSNAWGLSSHVTVLPCQAVGVSSNAVGSVWRNKRPRS